MAVLSEHRWSLSRWECLKCGMLHTEFWSLMPGRGCIGTAYVTRIVRRLMETYHLWRLVTRDEEPVRFMRERIPPQDQLLMRPPPVRVMEPYEYQPFNLARFVEHVVKARAGWGFEMTADVEGMLKAIFEDVTKLPILADALEEAGLQDERLLAILRLP